MPPASRDGRKLGGIRDRRQTFGGDNRCVAASGTPIRLQATCRAEIWMAGEPDHNTDTAARPYRRLSH
jgi:hypothetical protein